MFKLALKLAVATSILVGLSFSVANGKALAGTCPDADFVTGRTNWGVNVGEAAGAMAGATLHTTMGTYTYDGGAPSNERPGNYGDDLNGINYTINAYNSAEGNNRIFTYPAGEYGRKDALNASTGNTIYIRDPLKTQQCDGWTVMGPGAQVRDANGNLRDQWGDGWVLDCGIQPQRGDFVASRFWISFAANPAGQKGYWEVRIAGQGVDTNINNMGPDINNNGQQKYFTVTNGDTTHINLIWHPYKPHGTIKAGRCEDNIVVSNVDNGDGSGAFYVKLTASGGASPDRFPASGTYSGSSKTIPVPNWVKTRRGDTDVGVQLFVYNTATGGYTNVDNDTINEPWYCIPDSCPHDPTFQNPKDTYLEESGLPQSGNFNPNGAGPPGQHAHKYSWKDLFHISDVRDQYNMQATRWVPGPTDGNQPNPFKIFYNNYINQYPYDSHHVIVYYKAFYTDSEYIANGTRHNNGTRDWTGPYNSTGSVDLSKVAQDWDQCLYRGFKIYAPNDPSKPASKDPIGVSATLGGGGSDNPTNVKFGFSVPVNLFLPDRQTQLRHGLQVCGINYRADYYIKRANGTNGGALPGYPNDGGGLPGGCVQDNGGSNPRAWTSGPHGFPPGTLNAGDEICVNFTVSPSGNFMNQDGTIVASAPDVSATQCSAPVLNQPYFKVFNSGVSAGGEFTNCTSHGGLLAGWNDNTGADRGSSSQLHAEALANIKGFASVQSRAGASPSGLSFANNGPGVNISTDGDSPSLGGNFGASLCLTDANEPSGTTHESSSTATVGSFPLDKGAHEYSTNDLKLSGGTVGTGKNVTVFVKGHNVYIKSAGNGGIKYSTGGWSVTSSSTNVPSFLLVVEGGNIYIDPSITELDGTYIAKRDSGGGGKIYTCANDNFTPVAPSSMFSRCNQQLVIYGSFVANQINLMRTYGSLRDATAGEGSTGSHAAEIFRFSPEMYLSNPSIQLPNNGAPQAQSLTSLPPVL